MGSGDQPNKLSPREAERKIASILEDGIFEVTSHCRRDSMPKRSVTYPDIEQTLKNGHIIREPIWDDKHGQWKYIVEGRDLDGDELRAVTVIFEEDFSLLVITVY